MAEGVPTWSEPRGHARVPRAWPTLPGRASTRLPGVEVLLPLVLDLGHCLLRLGVAGPDGLKRLREKIAGRIDGEIGAAGDRDLALSREAHAVDEGAADAPGMAGGLVVGAVQDGLPRTRAATDGRPQETVVG